jgi:heme b synthase
MTKDMKMRFEPKWIAWEVTGRCNLNCIHCRTSASMSAGKGDFSTNQAFHILNDIASNYNPVIVLSGGEPLLRKDLFEIAKHGTELGLRMCIATNGTLITDRTCERIRDAQIKMVSLSLDGSTAEIHDNFRNQKGAFKGIIRAAKLLRKHEIPFLINSSFTKRNQADIGNVFKLAKGLGAKAWYMFMIVPTGRGKDLMEELISKEDYEEILKWHYQMEKDEDQILMRPTCAPQYYRIYRQMAKKEGIDFKHRSLSFSTGGAKGCIAGQLICLIDQHGNVQPCSYFPRYAGNIMKTPFKEIWEKSKLFLTLRDFKRYQGKCGVCEYLSVCGGCRARADSVYGNYLKEEPFCNYIPLKLRRRSKSATK